MNTAIMYSILTTQGKNVDRLMGDITHTSALQNIHKRHSMYIKKTHTIV